MYISKKKKLALQRVYFNPKHPAAFGGINKLWTSIRGAKKTQAQKWLSNQRIYQLHKPIRKKFPRNRVIVSSIDEQWQSDLCDMQNVAKQNDGIKFLLTIIDLFSKYAWVCPLKSKSGDVVAAAFRLVLSKGRVPEKLQTDKGKEFLNKSVQDVITEYSINYFTSQNDVLKCMVVERFNRTLKEKLYRYMTHKETYRYIDALDNFVYAYNRSKHRTIGMKPVDVSAANEQEIRERIFKIKDTAIKRKFEIGDHVVIGKNKNIFGKGYLPNWTQEFFRITKCLNRHPPTYRIEDIKGEAIEGTFLEPEMQKIDPKDNWYLIEKEFKRRTVDGIKQVYVKYKGWPDKFNEWVDVYNIKKL